MTILNTILLLCIIGVVAGFALYFVAKKFKVDENPLYVEVEAMLPGANCGGCGFPGCRKLAENMVDSPTLEGLYCSVGGAETMDKIGTFLGKNVEKKDMQVAVVRCSVRATNDQKRTIMKEFRRAHLQQVFMLATPAVLLDALALATVNQLANLEP